MSSAVKANFAAKNAPQIWIAGRPAARNHENRWQITQADLKTYSELGILGKQRDALRKQLMQLHDLDAHIEKGKYSVTVKEIPKQSLSWAAAETFLPRETVEQLRNEIETQLVRQLWVKP